MSYRMNRSTPDDLWKKLEGEKWSPIKGCPFVNQNGKSTWWINPFSCDIIHILNRPMKNGEICWTLLKNNPISCKSFTKNGFKIVQLDGHSVLLHRIMAETFLKKPGDGKFDVGHKKVSGGLRKDNSVRNLYWIPRSDNYKMISREKGSWSGDRQNFGRWHDGKLFLPSGEVKEMNFEEYLDFVKKTRGADVANRISLQRSYNKRRNEAQLKNVDGAKKHL